MSDFNEPDSETSDHPYLILELPIVSDEAALQLSEFLQKLAEHFDDNYSRQILRAHRAREEEYERLYRERDQQNPLDPQQSLPFEPDPF
jgi:hypothetical protein